MIQLLSVTRVSDCLTRNRVELVPWSTAATSGPSMIRCEDAAMVPFMGSPRSFGTALARKPLTTAGEIRSTPAKVGRTVAAFTRNLATSDDDTHCVP